MRIKKIKDLQLNREIYSCLVCDNLCGDAALKEGLQVIFHVCFNCMTLYEAGMLEDLVIVI